MPFPWIVRGTPSSCAVAFSLAALAGCGDDAVPAGGDTSSDTGDDSSAGSLSASTITSPSTSADESSTSASGSSDESESGSTTESIPAGPDIRVIYAPDTIANSRPLDFTDVIDGSASEPVTAVETLGTGTYQRIADHWLAVAAVSNAAVSAVDLASPGAPTVWALELPEAAVNGRVVGTNTDGSLWVVITSDGAVADLHVHPLADDGPGAPWAVDGDLNPSSSQGDVALALDDTRVAFRSFDADSGAASIWLGPASSDAPALEQIVETPDAALYGPLVDAGGTGLFYRSGGLPAAAQDGWFVDLASDPTGEPQPLGLLAGKQSFDFVRLAPDGSGAAITQGADDDTADVAWIAVQDGVPAAPVQLSTGASSGLAPFNSGWSPDARWLAFSTDLPRTLYVVPFAGGVPGDPVALTDAGVAADVLPRFSVDSQHGYYYAEQGMVGTIMRVALDGAAPGTAQAVSDELAVFQDFVVSADDATLCYAGAGPDDEVLHAWCVDVSGDAPAAPVAIDHDLLRDEQVFSVELSDDSNHLLYGVTIAEGGGRQLLLDRVSGLETVLAEGESVGFSMLFGLR
jgi:hypothetical protein